MVKMGGNQNIYKQKTKLIMVQPHPVVIKKNMYVLI